MLRLSVTLLRHQESGKQPSSGSPSHLCTDRNRLRFLEHSLVYDFNFLTWCSPSHCIWAADNVQLPEKFSVASQYPEQESFFLQVLGVTAPKLSMYITALEQKASDAPAKEDIKQMIRNICQFAPSSEDLYGLLHCKCLPIRRPDGTQDWMDCDGEFAIVDRREYGRLFSGDINTLDFSLEDVHSFETFLCGLGLREKYLSHLVDTKTNATGSSIDHVITADLRRKAYAICR